MPLEDFLLTIALNLLELVVTSLIVYYFYKQYQKAQLLISLYWALAFAGFFVGTFFSLLYFLIISQDLNFSAKISFAFAVIALSFLTASFFEAGIIQTSLRQKIEITVIILGVIGLLSAFLSFFSISVFFLIAILIINIFTLFTLLGYFYLSYQGRNLRLLFVTLSLLVFAVIGFLAAREIIDVLTTKVLRVIIEIFLFAGLTSFKSQ